MPLEMADLSALLMNDTMTIICIICPPLVLYLARIHKIRPKSLLIAKRVLYRQILLTDIINEQ